MEKYKNIIDLPYVKSNKRPRMSLLDRASQFAPFAALTGYEESLIETSRLTSEKIELLQEDKDIISAKLNFIITNKLDEDILFTYFIKDSRKKGGKYVSLIKKVKRIDEVNKIIYFLDNTKVLISNLIDIKSQTINSIFIDIK